MHGNAVAMQLLQIDAAVSAGIDFQKYDSIDARGFGGGCLGISSSGFCLPAEALRKVCVMWPRDEIRDNHNRELLRGLDDRNS